MRPELGSGSADATDTASESGRRCGWVHYVPAHAGARPVSKQARDDQTRQNKQHRGRYGPNAGRGRRKTEASELKALYHGVV
jgi:hypothetical protein